MNGPQGRPQSSGTDGFVTYISKSPGGDRGELPIFINAGDNLVLDELKGPSESLIPYKLLRNLGHGGSASVEEVEDVHTGRVYARKIFRNVYARNMAQAKQRFEDEVRIMKRLTTHHHIIRVHATYILKRELAIILDPVADGGDLASFLQDFRDSEPQEKSWKIKHEVLWNSVGCLASGLAFMHQQSVRHRVIKPQNILIHRGDVMYTDFGLSSYFGDAGQSTSTGIVQGMTKRYCAPEVANGASRNSKSDVFSLGCVYIEITAALFPGLISDEVLLGPFYEVLRTCTTEGTLSKHVGRSLIGDRLLVDLCILDDHPINRPSASQVVEAVLNIEAERRKPHLFCYRCFNIIR